MEGSRLMDTAQQHNFMKRTAIDKLVHAFNTMVSSVLSLKNGLDEIREMSGKHGE